MKGWPRSGFEHSSNTATKQTSEEVENQPTPKTEH